MIVKDAEPEFHTSKSIKSLPTHGNLMVRVVERGI